MWPAARIGIWAAAWTVVLGGCGLVLDSDDASNAEGGPTLSLPLEQPLSPSGQTLDEALLRSVGKAPLLLPLDCGHRLDAATLLLIDFDAPDAFVDHADRHAPAPRGTVPLEARDDRPRCGDAAVFAADGDNYVEVPDALDWQLGEGAVDFWFRLAEGVLGDAIYTFLSRDEFDSDTPGHFGVRVSRGGALQVRLQQPDGNLVWRTSESQATPGRWTHVLVNFGPPSLDLYVDGVLASSWPEDAVGIADNQNPWVIGAGARRSVAGLATPTSEPFAGAIDHLRVSYRRRIPVVADDDSADD